MRKLNLATEGREQERIKAYLEEHASEDLADKINNGTPFAKDGKTLTNRKTLKGFMDYARGEAQKQAAKGAQYAMIDDDVVFGWAIHYFEEDSIEGTLYTLDGEEYKPVKKAAPKPAPKPVEGKKQEPAQQSMFDLFDAAPKEAGEEAPAEEVEDAKNEGMDEDPIIPPKPTAPLNPILARYQEYQAQYPDAIIAMRVGDFYEVFGNDAITVGEKCGLTLTGRDFGLENRTPLVGFPFHRADDYLERMTEIRPVVFADEGCARYFSKANEQVDVETGEITVHKAYFADDDLIALMRVLDKVEVRL